MFSERVGAEGRCAAARDERAGRGPAGQVLVEVLLILPIFMLLVFMIMEIGHLSFRTILLHHAAYEAARIGSLTAASTPTPGCSTPSMQWGRVQQTVSKMLPGATVYRREMVPTLRDPQEGCMNYDVVVAVRQNVPMIFPMTGVVLGNANGRRARSLTASVRMPVERPLFK